MNLEKLLAANMVRFGVKNLNEQLQKTLLNEGLKPGENAPQYTTLNLGYTGDAETLLKQKVTKYTKDPLKSAAILAVIAGGANASTKNKQLNKLALDVTKWKDVVEYGTIPYKADPAVIDQILVQSANFTYEVTEVSVYPKPNSESVATIGTVGAYEAQINDFGGGPGGDSIKNQGEQLGSKYGAIIRYFNNFNLGNVTGGDFTQYRLSSMVDSNNYVNLLTSEVATNTIIVYTATTKNPNTAGKEIDVTKQGASAPIDKMYDVSFAAGVATVPPNDAEVTKAVADAIAMFPDGNISNLTIVSSASPEFNSKQGGPATLADYGTTPVTGTGQPNVGNDNIGRNIKLAYDRGVNFVAAINAGLAAQGKPEISNFTINWQISDNGGKLVAGRYANILWSKAGAPGKDVTKLDNTGKTSDVKSGRATYTIYQHVFTGV